MIEAKVGNSLKLLGTRKKNDEETITSIGTKVNKE